MVAVTTGIIKTGFLEYNIGRVLISRDCSAFAACRKRQVRVVPRSSGDLLTPSPPAEQATVCNMRPGGPNTCNGAGHGNL